ncbi:MAG: helix-turn-helix domain-containing protein [Mesorhizobium sp.]
MPLSLAKIEPIRQPPLPPDADESLASRHNERVFDLCDRVIEIASALFNVSGSELRDTDRNSNSAARVRQVAMYVTHVVFGLTMADVGYGFGRDRTTVRHACHLIEDLREDEDFDQVVAMMEKVSMAALRERLPR